MKSQFLKVVKKFILKEVNLEVLLTTIKLMQLNYIIMMLIYYTPKATILNIDKYNDPWNIGNIIDI